MITLLGKLLLNRVNLIFIRVDFLRRRSHILMMIRGIYVPAYWLLILEMHLLVAILNRRLNCCDMLFFVVVNTIFVVVTPV